MKKNSTTYALLLLFAFSIIALTSCSDEASSVLTKHVLLVYMGGDNNLSAETNEKLEAIAEGWNAEPGYKLLVYQDRKGVPPQLKEIVNENGMNTERLIEEYPEENSAARDVLARVIGTTTSLYPSSSYGLLLFSHASGWLPKGALGNPGSRSIVTDGKNEMELSDFAEAIPDHTFDYILFEACFMAGIEVAYELRNKANYILASSAEIISPGFTPVYTGAINSLFSRNLNYFGQLYFKYIYAQTGYRRSATLSVIKTSELTPLANWIKLNCDKTREVTVEHIQRFDRYPYRLFFDFGAYYSCLIDEDKQNDLQQLINNCIVWKDATPTFMPNDGGFAIDSYSGLSVYIPQASFSSLNEKYKKLEWYKALLL